MGTEPVTVNRKQRIGISLLLVSLAMFVLILSDSVYPMKPTTIFETYTNTVDCDPNIGHCSICNQGLCNDCNENSGQCSPCSAEALNCDYPCAPLDCVFTNKTEVRTHIEDAYFPSNLRLFSIAAMVLLLFVGAALVIRPNLIGGRRLE
jgi:hypothetical protein